MTNNSIKIVCFDLGGVLLEVNWQLTFDFFKIPIDPKTALQEIGQSQLFYQYEKGLISAEEFTAFINSKYGSNLSTNGFIEGWNKCLTGVLNGTAEIIQSIPPHFRIFALSNTNQDHYDYYRHFPLFKKFEKIIASQHLGLRKPDPKIYQKCIEITGASPSEILYFDDLKENVIGAQEAKMNALHVKAPAQDILFGLKKFAVL